MIQLINSIDIKILFAIQDNLRNSVLTPIFTTMTSLGNGGLIWITISIILLLRRKTRRIGIICLLALVFCVIINNEIIKNIVKRPRPFNTLEDIRILIPKPDQFSFPSGHSSISFAVASVLYRKLPKKYGIIIIVVAFLIAFSRIYVGVHYPTDVIFGALSGIILGYLAEFTEKKINNLLIRRKKTN
ncbi:phosphatase PAP2 family protein [Clostridium sp. BJN0001]|uniref:phosphatase PAP2 family protein n=1 Tax=Clostridium sp. BJN0001 TaxID=2930219 RepID=UPI001FD33754|nr:phosphatase PAP2 family protein [Clostridium sp. BJN0001]